MSTVDPTPPSDSPLTPLVAVAGPPGSGGEIIAEALAAMGLQLIGRTTAAAGEDKGGPEPGAIATGLSQVGDELLGRMDGTWWAPPELTDGWERLPEIAEAAARGVNSLNDLLRSDPDSPQLPRKSVWYDARHALLLPVWRQHPGVEAAVVTWRRPAASVTELAIEGVSPILALAIWEAHLVGALAGSTGLPLMGVDVDEVATDPKKWAASAASFLEDLGLELPIGAEDRATEVVEASPELTVAGVSNTIAAEEAAMAAQLKGMLDESRGAHRRWEPSTPYKLNPWTAALLSAERSARLSATQSANAWLAAEDAHRTMTTALSTLQWTVDRLASEALSELPPS
jgi:hypothetical protein